MMNITTTTNKIIYYYYYIIITILLLLFSTSVSHEIILHKLSRQTLSIIARLDESLITLSRLRGIAWPKDKISVCVWQLVNKDSDISKGRLCTRRSVGRETVSLCKREGSSVLWEQNRETYRFKRCSYWSYSLKMGCGR